LCGDVADWAGVVGFSWGKCSRTRKAPTAMPVPMTSADAIVIAVFDNAPVEAIA